MALRGGYGYLSEEDLQRYRRFDARFALALSGRADIPLETAEEWIVEYFGFSRQMRLKYDIPEEEEVRFSLWDGAITEDG